MTAPKKTLRLAMICSGNICRSPLAHVLAQRIFPEHGIPVAVISAGTLHINGSPAAAEAIAAAAEIGLSLTSHRSQGAQPSLLRFADHIVVMEEHHAKKLLQRAPDLAPRIVRLWQHYDGPLGPLTGISDPVGKNLDAFRACREVLEIALERWAASLQG